MDEQKKLRKIRLTQTTNVKRPKSNLKKMGHKATYLWNNTLIITSAAKDAVSTYNSIKSIDKKMSLILIREAMSSCCRA